jgi:cobalt-precorrin 5A hydrolase/precorrin-3B C17-methyltransferase
VNEIQELNISRLEDNRQISYFSLTAGGTLLALKLRDRFGGTAHLPRCHSMGCPRCDSFDSIAEALPERFRAGETLVCVMAAGIAFRVLAPHLDSKQSDPAVIVVDEDGRYAVPLLGGHAAGANRFAREIADFLDGDAVITTASDVQGLTAPDEAARQLGLVISDPVALRRVTALLVDGKPVCIESREDPRIDGYGWLPPGGDSSGYAGRLLITHEKKNGSGAIPTACLIPRVVVVGIGCRRGTPVAEISQAIETVCEKHGMDRRAIARVASIDIKQDENGLIEAAAALDADIVFFTAAELAALDRPGNSFVAETVGTPAVCEPAALLAAGENAMLVSGKETIGRVTVALAVESDDFRQVEPVPLASVTAHTQTTAHDSTFADDDARSNRQNQVPGRVLVVGTGAGTAPLLTAAAAAALGEAEIIMGYRTYIEQVRPLFPDKEYITGSMGAEIDRCREALRLAAEGRTVALVSSGDPGVYGMAGPLLELAGEAPVTVVPGVTAAQIAAARLGAPLMNDFITLSLSDLLTPREEVLRRARLAAASDLVICLYNPTSKKRRALYEEVRGLIAAERPADTPVGWVREAGGASETSGVIRLDELPARQIDMRTIIIIGNSRTAIFNGRMVTARGYEGKRMIKAETSDQ